MKKLLKKLKNKLDKDIKIHIYFRLQKAKISQEKRQQIIDKVVLSEKEKSDIDAIFGAPFNKKMDYSWHRYYYGVSGHFSADYFPEYIARVFEFYENSDRYASSLGDKIIQYQVLSSIPAIRLPELYCYSRKGLWFDKNNRKISLDEATAIILSHGAAFGKPIVDSCSGMGCVLLNSNDNNVRENLEKNYSDNYLFQGVLKCRDDIKALHPNSVNTFRVMTYKHKDTIRHCPIVLRIGREGSLVDNAHAGGICVGVHEDGSLCKYAVTEFAERFEEHPNSRICFEKYSISGVRELVKNLEEAHWALPDTRMASWDAIIDQEGNTVVIEVNLKGQGYWAPQITHGTGLFGKDTKDILDTLYKDIDDTIS